MCFCGFYRILQGLGPITLENLFSRPPLILATLKRDRTQKPQPLLLLAGGELSRLEADPLQVPGSNGTGFTACCRTHFNHARVEQHLEIDEVTDLGDMIKL